MYIIRNPDDWTTDIETKKCSFHQEFPELETPSCGCFTSYKLRKATPEEKQPNKEIREARFLRLVEARKRFPFMAILE